MVIRSLTDEDLEKMMDDDFVDRAIGLGPMSWKWYARSLKYAADILLEKYQPAIKKMSSLEGGRMDVPQQRSGLNSIHV